MGASMAGIGVLLFVSMWPDIVIYPSSTVKVASTAPNDRWRLERTGMPSHIDPETGEAPAPPKYPKKLYEKELLRLQEELVKMEEWVHATGARIVAIFE